MHRRMRRRAVAVLGLTIIVFVLADGFVALRSGHQPKAGAVVAVPLSISCPSSGVCLAVDNQGRFVSYRNGSWSQPRSLERDALTTISCGSASFCVAVDDSGRALVFNGLSWS